MDTKQNRIYLISYLLLLLVFLVIILWMTGPYLLALLLGATLALLINPFYKWLIKKGIGRGISATAVTVSVLALIIIPVTVFIIISVNQGVYFFQIISGFKEFPTQAITKTLSRWKIIRVLVGNPAHISVQIQNVLQFATQYAAEYVLELAKTVPGFLLQISITVISCFFFLLDGKKFLTWLFSLHAIEKNVQDRLMETFHNTAVSTILASFAAAAGQSVILFTGCLLLGIPGAFLIGGLAFVFAWMPIIGVVPVWAGGMIYLFLHGAITNMIFMLVIGIVASSIDNIIRALVLKGRSSMHPLIGLVSIIGGISMFGIMGVIVGPILIAMLISLLKVWPVLGVQLGINIIKSAEPESS